MIPAPRPPPPPATTILDSTLGAKRISLEPPPDPSLFDPDPAWPPPLKPPAAELPVVPEPATAI